MRTSPSLAALALLIAGCGSGIKPPSQNLTIGSWCSASEQCGTAPFLCDVSTPSPSCTEKCVVDGNCTFEAICIDTPDGGLCRQICDSDNQCRVNDGYRCVSRTIAPTPDGGAPIPVNASTYCSGSAPLDGGVPNG